MDLDIIPNLGPICRRKQPYKMLEGLGENRLQRADDHAIQRERGKPAVHLPATDSPPP